MNTVIFDVEGVVTYPGLDDQVIRPLEEKGVPVKFWTYSPLENGVSKLVANGLERYAEPGKCIGYELYDRLDNNRDLRYILEQLALPSDEGSVQQIKLRHVDYRSIKRRIGVAVGCKYPPLLGDGKFLLFESDSSKISERYAPLAIDDHLPSSDMKLAREAGYSIIIVPEHPDVWLAGEKKITPEDIVEQIRKRALSWNGEHIVEDLREKIGIYEEGRNRFKERR